MKITIFKNLMHKFKGNSKYLKLFKQEKGQILVLLLVVMLIIVILLTSVLDLGSLIVRKINLQDSADAAAKASAVWQARGLNFIGNANLVQLFLMLEYLLPPETYHTNRKALSDAAEQVSVAQEEVSKIFPFIGLISASIIAEKNGADIITPEVLREINLQNEADFLQNILQSSPVLNVLGGNMHAFPMEKHFYVENMVYPLSLGVKRAEKSELAPIVEAIIRTQGMAANKLLDFLNQPICLIHGFPLLFFGYLLNGTYEQTYEPGIEEESLELTYHEFIGGKWVEKHASVLTLSGKNKFQNFLGHPPPERELGAERYYVVPVLGPLTPENAKEILGDDLNEFFLKTIKLSVQMAYENPEFTFSYFIFDKTFWKQGNCGAKSIFLTWSDQRRSPEPGFEIFKHPQTRMFSLAQARPMALLSSGEENQSFYKTDILLPVFNTANLEKIHFINEEFLDNDYLLH